MYALTYRPEYIGIYYWRNDRSDTVACFVGHFLLWEIWYFESRTTWDGRGFPIGR